MADVIRAAEEAKENSLATESYTMKQMAALRVSMDRLNIKFGKATGLTMDEWDGTKGHLLRVLGHGPDKCSTIPAAPPLPPTPTAGASVGVDEADMDQE